MKHIALLAVVVLLGLGAAASAAPTPIAPEPATAAPAVGPHAEVAVLAGRWKLFFGTKICWGQVVNIPGESQCV